MMRRQPRSTRTGPLFPYPPLLRSRAQGHAALLGPRLAGLNDSRPLPRETVIVRTAEALRAAIAGARPGTVIELQPGTYEFSGAGLEAARPGLADLPIVVPAAALGTVRLRLAPLEGFPVVPPYRTFYHLPVEGFFPPAP